MNCNKKLFLKDLRHDIIIMSKNFAFRKKYSFFYFLSINNNNHYKKRIKIMKENIEYYFKYNIKEYIIVSFLFLIGIIIRSISNK